MAFQSRKITSTKNAHPNPPSHSHKDESTPFELDHQHYTTSPTIKQPWSSTPLPPDDPIPANTKQHIHQAAIAPKNHRRLRSGSVGISRTRFNIFPVGFWKEKKTHRLPGHMQQQAGGKWEKCPHVCLCMYVHADRPGCGCILPESGKFDRSRPASCRECVGEGVHNNRGRKCGVGVGVGGQRGEGGLFGLRGVMGGDRPGLDGLVWVTCSCLLSVCLADRRRRRHHGRVGEREMENQKITLG